MVPRVLLALSALSFLMAGCADDPPPESAAGVPVVEALAPVAPAGFTQTGSIEPSLYNPAYCEDFHRCVEFVFTVGEDWPEDTESRARMDARLAWGLPANNLDLVLYRGETELAADYENVGTEAAIVHDLEAGEYTLLIDPYNAVGADDFELTVTFGLADP